MAINFLGRGIQWLGKSVALPLYNTAKSWFAPSDDLSKSSLLSGLNNQFTGNLDYNRQLELLNKEMAFNASEAQKTREHNEYLSSTQYQRAVADMRKAGLNPYLAYNNGGNDIVSSSSASVSAPSVGKSGQGWSALAGFVGSLMRGMVSSSNAMLTASNAMQIAQIRDMTARLNQNQNMRIARMRDSTQRFGHEMNQTRYMYHFNRYNWHNKKK